MTLPRRVLPGVTYLVTRRCTQRQFLLKPSETVRSVFLYSLAYASGRYGVQVHAVLVLSNHVHLICTDPHGHLPRFMQLLDGLVARALNVHYKRGESFWAPGSYSAIPLTDLPTLLDKLVYVWANAVAAGLVARPEDWPGLGTGPEDMGTLVLQVERPSFFFRSEDEEPDADADADEPESARARARRRAGKQELLPARLELAITLPPLLCQELGQEAAHRVARELLERRIEKIARERAERGVFRVLGPSQVINQSPFDTPHGSVIPDGSLNPRVACRDRWRRMQLISQTVEFWQEHRAAFLAFREGDRQVLFPTGSYNARALLGARVRAHSPPAALAT